MSGWTLEHLLQERRSHPRYPVQLPVRFLIRSGKVISFTGEGKTVNISSTGMLFCSSKPLPDAKRVIGAVQWPATPDGKPRVLLFYGHMVWVKGSHIGMQISHYGFLSEDIPSAEDAQILEQLASPRRLTPTRIVRRTYSSVRQWKKSLG
jgi:hypothetical protein